jgi:hypothetical protein
MGGFADYAELELLDHLLGGADYARPATVYAGLSTTTPGDDGSNFTEPSGNAYARVAITNNATNFPAAAAGSKSNGTAVTFPQATGAWGTVTHFALYDASSGGNQILWGALTDARVIGNGQTASFAPGSLVVSLT